MHSVCRYHSFLVSNFAALWVFKEYGYMWITSVYFWRSEMYLGQLAGILWTEDYDITMTAAG